MTTVLRVEHVSKMYRLGEIGYGALREDLTSWWARVRGKEDPNASIHESCRGANGCDSTTIMALNDVSLELGQGEVTGIIGGNGAGKSTLLKLISGLTAPTRGRIFLRGRVGSLLEVGIGFHPELTGRENVFLNGAILGMTKAEVRRKFDEIVAFSGVERFIDTPVKRYSSGMYVRLGFSVAAHLEPEIMLIDEVLAVGDAEFQKKCREKIRRLSRMGHSVIFVSHNMESIREICRRGVVLNRGKIVWSGRAEEATRVHLELHSAGPGAWNAESFFGPLTSAVTYSTIEINGTRAQGDSIISPESSIRISCYGTCSTGLESYRTSVGIFRDGVRIFTLHDLKRPEPLPEGNFMSEVTIPPLLLRPGRYSIGLGGRDHSDGQWLWGSDLIGFEIDKRWTDQYGRDSTGLVNLQQEGRRVLLSG